MVQTLSNDDVIFVSPAADGSAYGKYGATVIVSGGCRDSDYVNRLKRLGLHVSGTVRCAAALSHEIHANPDLAGATARDIEGNPLAASGHLQYGNAEHPVYFG